MSPEQTSRVSWTTAIDRVVRATAGSRLLVIVAFLGAFVVAPMALNTVAQNATPGTAGPSLVGAWQWNSFPEGGGVCCGPEPSTFAIFHADGTYTEWQPVAGASIGI